MTLKGGSPAQSALESGKGSSHDQARDLRKMEHSLTYSAHLTIMEERYPNANESENADSSPGAEDGTYRLRDVASAPQQDRPDKRHVLTFKYDL